MDYGRGKGMCLDLTRVSGSQGPCTMSYGFDLDVLCESIRKVGLINPPLVALNHEGAFDIVSGYRRILALKALGAGESFCVDVTSVLESASERFFAAFYENLATRKFNDIEKAIILSKLQNHVTREEILLTFMPLLSLPSYEGSLEFYLKLLNLDEDIRIALAKGETSMKLARAFVQMDKGDRQELFHWFRVLKLNVNQQIKFLEYMEDISARENARISEGLTERSLLEIMEHPRLNTPQKARAVLESLRARRFPRLMQAQAAIEKKVSAIPMPPEASIRYDPNLEDPYYHLDIRFKHGADLKKTIGKLHALHQLEEIPEEWTGN